MYINVHHVLKCMSCHKAIMVITRRAHCFHDYIYINICIITSQDEFETYDNYFEQQIKN